MVPLLRTENFLALLMLHLHNFDFNLGLYFLLIFFKHLFYFEFHMCMQRVQRLELVAFNLEIEQNFCQLRRERRNQSRVMEDKGNHNPSSQSHQPRALWDYFRPMVNKNYLLIRQQAINANFKFKLALSNMFKQNHHGGLSYKDPTFIWHVLGVYNLVKMNGMDEDLIRMRFLFLWGTIFVP